MDDDGPRAHKSPIDYALDLLVYAPLGFVSEAPTLLPRFVKRGRDQMALVRAVGMYALRRDADELDDVLDRHPDTRTTLQALGLVPKRDTPPAGAARRDNDSNVVAIRSSDPVHAEHAAEQGDAQAPPASPPQPDTGSPAGDHEPPGPGIDPATLAIPDYESLSASQVVPRLESLTSDELEAIRQYENGNRARRTILNKIAQLQAS